MKYEFEIRGEFDVETTPYKNEPAIADAWIYHIISAVGSTMVWSSMYVYTKM